MKEIIRIIANELCLPLQEAIEEVQEEITQSFEYLENEDYGGSKTSSNNSGSSRQFVKPPLEAPPVLELPRRPKQELNAMAVGKTSFAERVRIFQSLGEPFKTILNNFCQ